MNEKIQEFKEGFKRYEYNTPVGVKAIYGMTCKTYEREVMKLQEQIKDAEVIIKGVLQGDFPDWYEEKYHKGDES